MDVSVIHRETGSISKTIEVLKSLPSTGRTRTTAVKSRTRKHEKGIGSNLKEIIAREMPGVMTCGVCRDLIEELNQKTPEQVREDIDNIVSDIFSRSETQAPKLWQRLAVKLDKAAHEALPAVHLATMKMLHGEPIDTTETEHRIRTWVLEAVETAEKAAKPPPRKTGRLRQGRSFGSAFRSDGSQPRFVSSEQFQRDIKTLVGMLPHDLDGIAGVARSGLSAATMVSMYLQLPLLAIRQTKGDVIAAGNGWRLGGQHHVNPRGNKIAIIDDTVMTGNSLRALEPIVAQQFDNVVTAAVYVNPLAVKKPDIWASDLGWPHLLEWNMFNSVLSPSLALDFDGILCQNCRLEDDDDGARYLEFIRNAKPLYTPRKCAVPLVVTARIEKYREPTLQWLQRHRIAVNSLVMHPADTLAKRNQDDICAYKAKHFKAWANNHRGSPGPAAFVESEDWQAKQIAARSGRMVICPATAKVY